MRQKGRSILIIDDDKLVLNTFKQILELEGYAVDTAETGKEAIEKSDTSFYNLALVDIRLPDMQGTQLLTSMRVTLPKMVKIIVTGYPSLESAKEAVNKGADGYMVKPILDMNTLLDTVKDHLKKQDEAREYSEMKVAEYIESRGRERETRKEQAH